MAMTQVTTIATTDPNVADWQALIDRGEKRDRGYESVTLTEYDTITVPQIAAGSVLEVNGTMYYAATAQSISGSASAGLNYIKFVADTPTWTTTAPTWSDAKQGWYEGSDRYLFTCYTDKIFYYDKKKLYPEQNRTKLTSAIKEVTGGRLTWEQKKLVASDAEAYDEFGYSVSISGDSIIIGAMDEDTGGGSAGAAYVFTRSGETWTEEDILYASDPAESDQFGYSVSIFGDYAIVGAHLEDTGASNAGAAYVFFIL